MKTGSGWERCSAGAALGDTSVRWGVWCYGVMVLAGSGRGVWEGTSFATACG